MITLYFFIVIVWVLFILGLKLMKDYAMSVLFAILIMVVGIYGLTNNFGFTSNILTYSFSLVNLFIGLYWAVRCSVELIRQDDSGYKDKWEVIEWPKKRKKTIV